MKVLLIKDNLTQAAKEFCLEYEKFNLTLIQKISDGILPIYAICEEEKILGLFTLSKFGQIHLLFSIDSDEVINVAATFILKQKIKLFSIAGPASSIDSMKKILFAQKAPSHEQEYFLLQATPFINQQAENKQAESSDKNQQIRKCCIDDLDSLLPLQAAYEKEEVIFNGREVNLLYTKSTLKKAIEAGQVFAIFSEGKILSKMNISAQGENHILFGGVFTPKEYRRHGFAGSLINFIVNSQGQNGKKSVLFVKTDNLPALRLYASCGFAQFGNYKICYF